MSGYYGVSVKDYRSVIMGIFGCSDGFSEKEMTMPKVFALRWNSNPLPQY